jgi:hypothetical protein
MNNVKYRVLNADVPVIYAGVGVHIHVKCVTTNSVNRAFLQEINAYIVVSSLMYVNYVIRHSIDMAI